MLKVPNKKDLKQFRYRSFVKFIINDGHIDNAFNIEISVKKLSLHIRTRIIDQEEQPLQELIQINNKRIKEAAEVSKKPL